MKYKIPKAYWWYFPDEYIKISTTREPTYFRRFVMWLFHNASFRVEYQEIDTQNIKQYQQEDADEFMPDKIEVNLPELN